MACTAVQSGRDFLASALSHVDCQAQAIGAYGFGALANPGSVVSVALGSLLTIFIALFGIRLLLGYPMAGRDIVADALKVGIVLTLAMSWPAWRVLGYDLVINGPGELARVIGLGAGLPGGGGDLTSRLQRVDQGLAALNTFGSGRLGVAQGDWFQLGFARIAFLTGTLGPLALIRLTTGILLAIAPLMAWLLLFGMTRPIFAGWAKGLVMAFLGSLAATLVLGAQLALLEPWLADTLRRRQMDQQMLDAPVEILVVTFAFALVMFGVLAIVARIAFHPGGWSQAVLALSAPTEGSGRNANDRRVGTPGETPGATMSRATTIAMAVSENLRREERIGGNARQVGAAAMAAQARGSATNTGESRADPSTMLGGSYRRPARRVSSASQKRDRGT